MAEVMIKPQNLMGVEKALNHPVLCLIQLTAYQEVACLFIFYPLVAPLCFLARGMSLDTLYPYGYLQWILSTHIHNFHPGGASHGIFKYSCLFSAF